MNDWRTKAECRFTDWTVFFTPAGRGHYTEARAICDRCTVRPECLSYILGLEVAGQGRAGVWGGLTPDERDAFVRARRYPVSENQGKMEAA